MTEEAVTEEINYEEQYGLLSEECKKLKIDISSLQLSNRSLVNQNRDEKKKVMDCRLQIADLEGRLKSFEATKQELSDCQAQCDRIRMTLESNEAKLADAERRADEAGGLIKIKDSVILKQSNFTKEIEERLRNVTEDRDRLLLKSNTLENDLNAALIRGDDADELREKLKKLEELFDVLANEKSETTSESGLAAANEYFKAELAKSESKIVKLKETKAELEENIEKLEQDKKELLDQMDKQMDDYEKLSDKCATLEARIKEMAHSERRYGGGMMGSRLIGPTLPPWIADEKKMENDLERLSKADPATLRAKVMELESQLSELNQLLTYREDVILRIHEEISKKASKLEAAEVERSSLNAQVSILKRELATAREDLARRGVGPLELEAEIERLRGKRDREYQRRKRIEADLDEVEKENQDLKQRIKRLEEAVANVPPPKPAVPQSDPSDRNRIVELQGTVNQLRMDNEAKRSELFDLRSRFDAKSAQMDKIAAELKTKERTTSELTSQFNTVRSQLETTTKELESVRCRAVRGGAEVERWHADLNSLQITNKFLSAQLNAMRAKMIAKDHYLSDITKRFQSTLHTESKTELVNGELGADLCVTCGDKLVSPVQKTLLDTATQHSTEIYNEVSSQLIDENAVTRKAAEKEKLQWEAKLDTTEKHYMQLLEEATEVRKTLEKDKLQLETRLTATQHRAKQLSEDVARERQVVEVANSKVQQLTAQISDLESSLSSTRAQLFEAKSDQRKIDLDAVSTNVSPPVKRTRRSATGANAKTNHQDCSSCIELRKQNQSLEASVSECNSRENALTLEINNLRREIADADISATKLRSQLSDLHVEMANKGL
ncbi:Ribosome binding protein 1 [Paragonimus heterotremus]|uniref:Ribosome binding protein 1 n=1 Tax=Paragonimus heterotremus TaxID=100268 RepID=A0A8J4SLY5_9TREM|nr:Ribosome binding protein 1 [Paragonimus heterotremus]